MDNTVCISGISKNGARDYVYQQMITKVLSLVGKKNITLALEYIPTELNPADKPSRPSQYGTFPVFSPNI